MSTINAQLQIWSQPAATWTADNPTLAEGQFGKESDTGALKNGDGVTAWNDLNYISTDGTWYNFSPSYTGFSADPTLSYYRYCIIGKLMFVVFAHSSNGTSNATTTTMTLPAQPANNAQFFIRAVDNGTFSIGRGAASSGSNVCSFFPSAGTTAWTGSGQKNLAGGEFFFEIA